MPEHLHESTIEYIQKLRDELETVRSERTKLQDELNNEQRKNIYLHHMYKNLVKKTKIIYSTTL